MISTIVLDSTPLGLLTQRRGIRAADDAQDWLARHLSAGTRIIVPEIVDYELRRELLRLAKTSAVARLDAFNAAMPDRYLPLTTPALRFAAELWAQLRQAGIPTADPHALDGDVILAAQVRVAGLPSDTVVATGNIGHLARVVNAALWANVH
jgi:predicted nucleic acid-binding protein